MRRSSFLVLLAAVALAAGGSEPPGPRPLRGVPLVGKTGLQLLVANDPPFVLDVDRGRVTPVTGLPEGAGPLWVLAVGSDAVVGVDRSRSDVPEAGFYVVRRRTTSARFLGAGWVAAPSRDGRAVWLAAYADAKHCTLREIGLDGRELRAPGPFECASGLDAGGTVGLLVRRPGGDTLVEPTTGRTLFRHRRIVAVAGVRVLSARQNESLTLTDLAHRTSTKLRWPSRLYGLDAPAVHPRGRLVAVGFADPAWGGGSNQAADVWLLDTATRRMRELPDMPAFVHLKFTSMTWARDGRLVLLAETDAGTVVGVWRPGDSRIAVKRVRLPERDGGSDSFVAW